MSDDRDEGEHLDPEDPYDEANTRHKNGSRRCRSCHREAERKRRDRVRQ